MSVSSHQSVDEERDEEFLHFYQSLKFREDADDVVNLAHVKRTELLLNHSQSKQYKDRTLTNWLLSEDLDGYAEVVDDRNGLNDYAEYITSLCRKSMKPATGCSKWKSALTPDVDYVKSMIRELSLFEKSPAELEADRAEFRAWRANMAKNRVTATPASQPRVSPQLTSSCSPVFQKPSTFQMKKPVLSATGSFHPAKSFTSMVMPQERNNVRGPVLACKRSINEVADHSDKPSSSGFRTAKTELNIQNMKKYGAQNSDVSGAAVKRSLGGRSRSINSKFVPPIKSEVPENQGSDSLEEECGAEDERLKGLDPKMIELIRNEIMDHGSPITWDDISGLEFAKKTIQEIVVWPLLRPDIFTGLRRPPKGILLFGPPGTGKTLIGKCIASQSSSTFFSISASSLTSKWIGESEKLVRTLFAVARCHQPAVIFIDEIDSLLSQRNESEHESSRRIKTEFLVQLDGATTHEDDRILVIGATNRPQELDEAARRRLVKRLYIPLPEHDARKQIVQRLMSTEKSDLTDEDVNEIAELTNGYSGADMKNLCQEASLEPIRSIDFQLIKSIESQEVRAVTLSDFKSALKVVRSSVSSADLNQYFEWDKVYGSRGT